jgi:TetR/AcrR family transcriptional repressor of nem operon
MARTKEFNPDEALDAAVEVFWKLGYEHTSLDALMRKMDIARQSLYDTFGDKRSLFLKAIARYRDRYHARLRKVFADEPSVKAAFSRILLDLSQETRREHERACLLLSANMVLASHDPEVADFLRDNQATLEEIFGDALKRSRKRGEISSGKDPAALARFFVATIQGMRAIARLNHDRKALESIAGIALGALD